MLPNPKKDGYNRILQYTLLSYIQFSKYKYTITFLVFIQLLLYPLPITLVVTPFTTHFVTLAVHFPK